MEKQNEQNPVVETEKVTIDTHAVEVSKHQDNTISVTLPSGLSEEETAALKQKLESGSSLIGLAQKQKMEQNRKEEELAAREKALAEKEAALAKQPETKKDDEIVPVWKRLGLNSEADLDSFATENPRAYMKAERAHMEEVAERKLNDKIKDISSRSEMTVQQRILQERITAKGHDPAKVKAFADFYNMPFSDNAYDLYTKVHSEKSDPVREAQRKAQQNQINYIESGRSTRAYTKSNISEASDAELDEIINKAKSTAGRNV